MNNEIRHLCTKIRLFEDMLLRSKNAYEIETIQKELTKMRANLQRLQFNKGS